MVSSQPIAISLSRLFRGGIDPDFPEEMNIALQTSNFMMFTGLAFTSIYLLFSLLSQNWTLLAIHVSEIAVILFGFYAIRKGHSLLGRVVTLMLTNINLAILSLILGKDSMVHMFFLPTIVLPFFTFESTDKKAILSSSFFGLICWTTIIALPESAFAAKHHTSLYSPWIPVIGGPLATAAVGFHAQILFQKAVQAWSIHRHELAYQSRMAALGEMAGGIAHEINSPLTVIAGSTSLIRLQSANGAMDQEKFWAHLQRIEHTTKRIARIVAGLNSFASTESQMSREFITTETLMESVLNLCSEKFRLKGITIKTEKVEPALLQGKPALLTQAILNIVNNAHDAIIQRQEKWIEIRGHIQGKEYVFEIIDSGRGILPEIADRMMQPFFTTKQPGQATGLGLPISHGIVAQHQGQIFYDQKSPNTKFVIRLPLNKENTLG